MTPGKIYRIDSLPRRADESAAAWLFNRLATALEERPLPPQRRAHLCARILDGLQGPPRRGTRTVRAADCEWCSFAPGVSIKLLRSDATLDNMTAYIRMEPGTALDSHVHHQAEECLVIEGEIFIGAHPLCAGDMHVAEAGTVHPAITSPRGALLLVRAQRCA